tara:strand:+ start:226 stop:594 length:369 start_codon:yes stop_codon:yes gene_type:complete
MVLSCSQVQIKDSEWFGNLPDGSAIAFHFLTPENRELSREQWDQERVGMVCTKSDNFGDWKAALEKLCRVSGKCSYQTKKKISQFIYRMNSFRNNTGLNSIDDLDLPLGKPGDDDPDSQDQY